MWLDFFPECLFHPAGNGGFSAWDTVSFEIHTLLNSQLQEQSHPQGGTL